MAQPPFVETRLFGFFEPAFSSASRVLMRIETAAAGMLLEPPLTRVYDARHLQPLAQKQGSFSEARFFEEHGFVLLPHESAVQD